MKINSLIYYGLKAGILDKDLLNRDVLQGFLIFREQRSMMKL